MKILREYASAEITVKGSRFLGEVFPCERQNEVRKIIKSQKLKYMDSTHVVHAFIIGLSGEIMGMSDDGEPSGTAGRPVLDVLKGRNCTNLVLTVTRWFGGTLLGTGGLVKAYGNAAKQVLDFANQSGFLIEHIETIEFSFVANYSIYKTIKHTMQQFNISDLKENFTDSVEISAKIAQNEYELFCQTIKNLSNGEIVL